MSFRVPFNPEILLFIGSDITHWSSHLSRIYFAAP